MDEFSIRKAIQHDAPIIRKMVIDANLNPFGLGWQRFLLAVDSDGMVIGCVQIKTHRDGSVEMASLVVAEDWRGRGVARALIESVIDVYTGRLYLMCRAGLGDFYQRFEFEVLGPDDMPRYFRQISKLAKGFQQLIHIGEGLLVMGREC